MSDKKAEEKAVKAEDLDYMATKFKGMPLIEKLPIKRAEVTIERTANEEG